MMPSFGNQVGSLRYLDGADNLIDLSSGLREGERRAGHIHQKRISQFSVPLPPDRSNAGLSSQRVPFPCPNEEVSALKNQSLVRARFRGTEFQCHFPCCETVSSGKGFRLTVSHFPHL